MTLVAEGGSVPFWNDEPDLWDTVSIDGRPLPGKAEVEHSLGRKLDDQSPPGADGANIRDKGYKLAKISVELTLWTAQQLEEYADAIFRLSARRRASQRSVHTIQHPSLFLHGISRVYLEEIEGLKKNDDGTRTAKLSFVEYNPPTRSRTTRRARPDPLITLRSQSGTTSAPTPSTASAAATAPSRTNTGP